VSGGRPKGCQKTQKSNKKKWRGYVRRDHERFALFPAESDKKPKKRRKRKRKRERKKIGVGGVVFFLPFLSLSLSLPLVSIDTWTNGVDSSRRKATSQLNLCQPAAVDNVVHFSSGFFFWPSFFLLLRHNKKPTVSTTVITMTHKVTMTV